VLQNVYISLPYVTGTRTPGIDRNEEITSLSLYVYNAQTESNVAEREAKDVRKQVLSTSVNSDLHVLHVGINAVDSVHDEHPCGQPANQPPSPRVNDRSAR